MFPKLIYHFFTVFLAIGAMAHFVDGVGVDTISTAAIVAAALTLLHATILPLAKAFRLPINLVTLTILALIFNVLGLWFLGSLLNGFVISSLLAAVFGSILLSILGWFNNRMVK